MWKKLYLIFIWLLCKDGNYIMLLLTEKYAIHVILIYCEKKTYSFGSILYSK